MTIHWKALQEHFLIWKIFWWKYSFSNYPVIKDLIIYCVCGHRCSLLIIIYYYIAFVQKVVLVKYCTSKVEMYGQLLEIGAFIYPHIFCVTKMSLKFCAYQNYWQLSQNLCMDTQCQNLIRN
jgi:hypothetical protein